MRLRGIQGTYIIEANESWTDERHQVGVVAYFGRHKGWTARWTDTSGNPNPRAFSCPTRREAVQLLIGWLGAW
jgi:hypothetical protein